MTTVMSPPLAKNGTSFPKRPPQSAFDSAQDAALRLGGRAAKARQAPLRVEFIRSDDADLVPPLTRVLRSSPMRLRLYLSLVWFSGAPPFNTTVPAPAWAELLGLAAEGGNGARLVSEAITWLDQAKLVRANRRPGQPTEVVLLREDGSGDEYEPPWEDAERYRSLPAEFWTKQWITALSGPSIAVWLILDEQRDTREPEKPVWLSLRNKETRHGLSPDTWRRATRELSEQGLVEVVRRPVSRSRFDWVRQRNTFRLIPGRFLEEPIWYSPPQRVRKSTVAKKVAARRVLRSAD